MKNMKIEIRCYSFSERFVCREFVCLEYHEFAYTRFFSNFKRMKKWNGL